MTDNKQTEYITAGGMSIAKLTNGTPTYLYTDHLGSTIMEADVSGNVIATSKEQYAPFGEKLNNASSNQDDVSYTGHIEDSAIGLTYMQARYYDPVVGRFYSSDPVGFVPGNHHSFNRYAYVNNNPYQYTDPTGLYGEGIFGPRSKKDELIEPSWNKYLPRELSRIMSPNTGQFSSSNTGGQEGGDSFSRGVKSYFNGAYANGRQFLRRAGLMGKVEKQESRNEQFVIGSLAIVAVSHPKTTKEIAIELATQNPKTVTGRLSVMAIVGVGLSAAGGVYGGGLGVAINGLAINGNVRDAAESEMNSVRDLIFPMVTGGVE